MTRRRGLVLVPMLFFGCAETVAPQAAKAPATTTLPGGLAEGAPREPLEWAEFSPATFARAKAERRFIVMDGSAEWCHWCHVMEATTYHDAKVAEILRDRFIKVKVDVDSRPDIQERYGDWGWPATVIFSPDAEELGKYRGYITPEDFLEILHDVVATTKAPMPGDRAPAAIDDTPLSEETLAWISSSADVELEEYWDPKEGGWGRMPKVPLGSNNTWAIARAKAGNAVMKSHLTVMLDKERSIMDPVWGGIYQYSVAKDWVHPHFEKLMQFNSGALDNYASAYSLTKNASYLETARSVQKYFEAFLLSKEGAFHGTQDADLNAHEPGKTFLSGEKYYALDDAGRRKLGIPRVDPHEYASDNGLAIAAYVALFEATHDAAVLATAKRAAERILSTHASPHGGLTHDAITKDGPSVHILHLADNATFGLGLMRLYEVEKDPKILQAAAALGDFIVKEFPDASGGGFFGSTEDPDAVGVFKARRKPFEDNVTAIRFLARLERAQPKDAYKKAIDRALRAIATPDQIKKQGRFLGDFLLALEESKGAR